LVKIQDVPDYEPPKKNDPLLVDPLKIGKRNGKRHNQNERQKSRRNLEYLLEFAFKFEKISSKTHQK